MLRDTDRKYVYKCLLSSAVFGRPSSSLWQMCLTVYDGKRTAAKSRTQRQIFEMVMSNFPTVFPWLADAVCVFFIMWWSENWQDKIRTVYMPCMGVSGMCLTPDAAHPPVHDVQALWCVTFQNQELRGCQLEFVITGGTSRYCEIILCHWRHQGCHNPQNPRHQWRPISHRDNSRFWAI